MQKGRFNNSYDLSGFNTKARDLDPGYDLVKKIKTVPVQYDWKGNLKLNILFFFL